MSVSIIIPVHNSEEYLEECVNSVLPGMNEDDEIILVENGSSDSSWDICQRYSSQYPNIKAVSLDAAGVSIARNKGIALAECDWIHFLDSDDVMDPGFLAVAHRMQTDADIVLFQYRFLGEGDGVTPGEGEPLAAGAVDPDLLRRGALQFVKYQDDLWEKARLDNVTVWSGCAKLIRRELVKKNKIHFPEKLYLGEDCAFSLQLYCCAEKVVRVEQNAFFYRVNWSSVSRGYNPKILANNQYMRKWIVYYTRKKCFYEELSPEISAFLCRKFIEECLNLKRLGLSAKEILRYIKENASVPFMKKAAREAGYRDFILGKRNVLRYYPFLWLLKRKWYWLMLAASELIGYGVH